MRRSEFLGVLAALPVVGAVFKSHKPGPHKREYLNLPQARENLRKRKSGCWGFSTADRSYHYRIAQSELNKRCEEILNSPFWPTA